MTAGSVFTPLILPIDPPDQKRKAHISTKTRLCLSSESRDAEVFFTLDGSKPDPHSRKYTAPIVLPPGRVCVRATAWTRDGRKSSTVTKVFMVEDVNDQSPRSTNHSPPQIIVTTQSAAPAPPTNHKSPQRCLLQRSTSCLGKKTSCKTSGQCQFSQNKNLRPAGQSPSQTVEDLTSKIKIRPLVGQDSKPEDSRLMNIPIQTEKKRIERDDNFLRCPDCQGPRPLDPAAIHCSWCGTWMSAIQAAVTSTEKLQMRSCLYCESQAPVSNSCLICDGSLTAQLRPQSSPQLAAGVRCSACGAVNPGVCSSCVCCDTILRDLIPCRAAEMLYQSQPVRRETRLVTCYQCGASASDSALLCATCGASLAQSDSNNEVTSDSLALSEKALSTVNRSTQTTGLYFPSATAFRTKQNLGLDQDLNPNLCRSPQRRRGLSAVSPGRGFWRQQVDHVCAHLRSHAQNHAPFRTLLGEPHLGRLVSAAVQEDAQEVTLLLRFSSRPRQNNQENLDDNQTNVHQILQDQMALQENHQDQIEPCSDRATSGGGSSIVPTLD